MYTKPLRSTDIRERNEKLVLNLIHKKTPISQSEIALLTGLKPPTIFRIFSGLEKKRLISACDRQEGPSNKKGRRPVSFQVNPDIFYTVGVDWTKTPSIVIVDFSGRPVFSDSREFPSDTDAETSLRLIADMISESIERSGVPKNRLLGIGIGCPGKVNTKTGTIINYPRTRGMVDFPIREKLEKLFKIPVHIHNNCSIIALSEYRYGKARDAGSLLTVLIRTGIGGALIINGSLFVNRDRTSLEIGHMSVDMEGRRCYCGRRGCLESYLAEDVLVADSAAAGIHSLAELETALEKKDPAVLSIMDEKGTILSAGIMNLINLVGPDTILIVTRFNELGKYLAERVDLSVNRDKPDGRIEILSAPYDPVPAGKAATDLVIENFFHG
jgi:predicted NBD/HSP70 family sugar kinase